MYMFRSTAILFNAQARSTFPTASGIKQGCRLSGTCFALGLDPLIQCYMYDMVLLSSRIIVFADIAVAFLFARRQLPQCWRCWGLSRMPVDMHLRPNCPGRGGMRRFYTRTQAPDKFVLRRMLQTSALKAD